METTTEYFLYIKTYTGRFSNMSGYKDVALSLKGIVFSFHRYFYRTQFDFKKHLVCDKKFIATAIVELIPSFHNFF